MEHTSPQNIESSPDPRLLVEQGLARAAAHGFDLNESVKLSHSNRNEATAETAKEVTDTAAHIAGELQLDKEYFDSPARTILLMGIADSWLATEKRASNASHDSKLADERAMLADAALMVAGKHSGFARELVAGNMPEASRYICTEQDAGTRERLDFFESISDAELAAQVETILNDDSPSSVLYEQRTKLGVTAQDQQPFSVRVLKMGNYWELQQAGTFKKIEWPDWDEDLPDEPARQARLEAGKAASANLDAQKALAKEYESADNEYAERFKQRYGELAPAFIWRDEETGKVEMVLRAAEAIALVQTVKGGYDGEVSEYARERAVSTVRHEFAHTQKDMTMGARTQLGLILEERKAELVSHDKLGYLDIKYLVNDLSMANDVNILDGLERALTQKDALSAFLAWSSNEIGLRNSLMLMISKPIPYESDPDRAAQFAATKAIRHGHDASIHDALVRENLEVRGDTFMKMRAVRWAGKLIAEKGVDFSDFIQESFIPYREQHGLTHASKYLREAVNGVVADLEHGK